MNWLSRTKEFFVGIPEFFSEVKSEMKKVSFPSRDEVVGTTIVVVITSFIFAVFLWLADLVILRLFRMLGT
jgi:preprotein translocase subunit SecE